MLLYMRPHTTPLYVSSCYYINMCPHTTNMCPHTAILTFVSSYYYMCPHTTIYGSSYSYICVLILGASEKGARRMRSVC
jgi:hypothetical protein